MVVSRQLPTTVLSEVFHPKLLNIYMMKNILVMAYQISPTKGSEYSVAWNYVKRMSKYNRLTVLCGVSGEHIGDVMEMEEYVKENNIPNVEFIFVKSDWFIDILNSLNRRGIFVYTFYIAYKFWQKKAYKIAKEVVKKEEFDLIHYLGPIGYREPGLLWKLDLPYMWGPIGGMSNINPILMSSLGIKGKIKLGVRRYFNNIQLKYKSSVKKVIKRADLLLSATTNAKDIIKRIYKTDSLYLPENGIDKIYDLNSRKFNDMSKLQLIIVGRLDANKSVITILKVLSKVKSINRVVLNVVGDGPLADQLKEYAQDNGLSQSIVWHGKVDREKVFELMNDAHLHVITSVGEGNPTTIWEAMSVGVPTLSLDHCGMHDTICERCGFRIPIISYDQIVEDIASQIQICIENPAILEEKAKGTIECADKYTWEKREAFWLDCYKKAIANYKEKK